MDTPTLLQYILIFLVLFWPVWALAIVFLHWLLMKTGSILGSLKTERPVVFRRKEQQKPVEKILNSGA
jgi:hypothetical protein